MGCVGIGNNLFISPSMHVFWDFSIDDLRLSASERRQLEFMGISSAFGIFSMDEDSAISDRTRRGVTAEAEDYCRKHEISLESLEECGMSYAAIAIHIARRIPGIENANTDRAFKIMLDVVRNHEPEPSLSKVSSISPDSSIVKALCASGFYKAVITEFVNDRISSYWGGLSYELIIRSLPDFLQIRSFLNEIIEKLVETKKITYSKDFGCYVSSVQIIGRTELLIPTVLKKLFTADFYIPSQLEKEFVRYFPDGKCDIFEDHVLAFIGLTKHKQFLLRSSIKSPSRYFKELILSKPKITETMFPEGMWGLQSFRSQLAKLESSFDVVRISDDLYLPYSVFSRTGITKESLKEFARRVRADMSNGEIFTVHSYLDSHGISQEFEEYDFATPEFFENILLKMTYFTSEKFCGVMLLKVGTGPIDKEMFLRQVVSKHSNGNSFLDIYDLCQILANAYGIDIDDVRLKRIAYSNDNGLYYDKYTDRIYCSKKSYLDDDFWGSI